MKKIKDISKVMILLIGIVLAGLINPVDIKAEEIPPYVDGEVIVVYKNTDPVNMIDVETDACMQIETDGELSYTVVDLDKLDEYDIPAAISDNWISDSVLEAVDYFNDLPGVLYAQPNFLYELESVNNDAKLSEQWYWNYFNMDRVHEILKEAGAQKIRVAVIDTGVDMSHPDLTGSINSVFSVNTCSDSYTQVISDNGSNSHGTLVAGIIAAKAGNGIGVAGIASGHAEICALQVQNAGGSITTTNVIRALAYARNIQAKIINMSMGTYADDNALKDALRTTQNAGSLIVCSAGNDASNREHYPSKYDSTIGIIASDKNGKKYSSSNYGTDNFISAPGEYIYSTIKNGGYGAASGSSMAAAVLSGIAADVWACDPSMSAEDVKNILASTATDTYTAGFDEYSGWGVVNPLSAVSKVTGIPAEPEVTEPEVLPNTTEGFVERLYRYCLNRSSDTVGMQTWAGALNSKEKNGAEVAYGFLFSKEFLAKNVSDEEYVEILYTVFLNREGDATGKETWMKALREGMSRLYVMNGFSGSGEFAEICSNCGIQSGQMPIKENRDRNQGYTAFVARLYQQALGRNFDSNGLNDWTGLLNSGEWNAYRVATEGFFHSPEFLGRALSNEEFVRVLYPTFLGRTCDDVGLRDWTGKLNSRAMSRDQVIDGFANSGEFRNIMAEYGL